MNSGSDDENLFVSSCSYYTHDSFNADNDLVNSNSLLIFHHNIRSFSKNFDELAVFLDSVRHRFHIIVLTETWFTADNVAHIDYYTGHHTFRADRQGGGVSVYVVNNFKSEQLTEFSLCGNSYELCTAKVKVCDDEDVYIMGVYRPPNYDNFEYHLDNYLQLLNRLCIGNRRVFVAGDFNVDTMCDDLRSQLFSDAMRSVFLIPLINIPTRITTSSQTIIDNIWTNQLSVTSSGVFVVDISDHFPIFTVAYCSIKGRQVVKYFRDHSQQSLTRLEASVTTFVANYHIRGSDVEAVLSEFLDGLIGIYNDCCAIRSKCYSVKSIAKPWVNMELRAMIRRKHYLFKQFKSGGCTFSFYNNFKNIVSKQIKSAKRQFYRRKLCGSTTSAETWKILRKLLNERGKTSNIALSIEGAPVGDEFEVASAFNSYFAGIADQIERDIPPSNREPMSYMTTFESARSFYAAPSSPQEVYNIIAALKLKGAPLSEIPTFIFRKVNALICPLISTCFNMSVTSGVFPNVLKCARIVPIHKAGDKNVVGNYRPISTLSVVSKIFEILMCRRMKNYIDRFSLLSGCQFGFRQNYATVDAVTQFLDHVCNALDDRKCLVSVFIDFQKAFDTVDHDILMRKLYILGFRGPVGYWLKSYLTDRRQCVSVNGIRSQQMSVRRGVPQGSVLGPLLFNLYINDMHTATGLDIIHYADDTTVFQSGVDVPAIVRSLNAELVKLDDWLRANRLSLNVAKSKVMVFTKRRLDAIPPVQCRGAVLDFVQSFKFLGVTLDGNLSFKNHGMHVVSRLSRSLGVMRKLSYTLPANAMFTLYYSIFYSHLTYAVVVWGNASQTISGRISSLQRQAVKSIDLANTVDNNFNRFRILRFSDVIKYFCAQKFFKSVRDENCYFYRKTSLAQIEHSHATRFAESGSLTNIYCRTNCSLQSFLPQAIKCWNELPSNIKSATTYREFKIMLKRFYLRQTPAQ